MINLNEMKMLEETVAPASGKGSTRGMNPFFPFFPGTGTGTPGTGNGGGNIPGIGGFFG